MEEDHLFHLNYAITLLNNDDVSRAAEHQQAFERLYAKLDDDAKNADAEVVEQRALLAAAVKERASGAPRARPTTEI